MAGSPSYVALPGPCTLRLQTLTAEELLQDRSRP